MRKWSDIKNNINSIDKNERMEISQITDIVYKIVQRREELGISQRELAVISGVKQSAIARFETMGVVPRLDTLCKVLNSLGLDIKICIKEMQDKR